MAAREDSLLGSNHPARPGDPLDLQTSVAGEEDPGASIDLAQPRGDEGRNDQPAGQAPLQPSNAQAQMLIT